MENVAKIDFKKPYSKIVEVKPTRMLKQKVFWKQNGIDYDIAGNAVNVKQVEQYYTRLAENAQKAADDAKESAKNAAAQAREIAAAAKAQVASAAKA